MKREIKFRGKRVDNGEWEYGSLVMVCNGETLKRYPCIVISYNYDTFDWHEVIPETVGQFTGLQDKNGKDIFEGDIVYCIDNPTNYDTGNYIVEFKNGCFYAKYSIENWPKYWIEVIGNIYDNPGLLQ